MKFSTLFRKYRLRSEFETLSEFSNALSEEGYIYNESLYSHWQKGSRIPRNRPLLLAIIHLFIKRAAITTLDQVNEFMEAAGQGYVTHEEQEDLPMVLSAEPIWIVPGEITTFVGRELEQELLNRALLRYETVMISGQPGIGKTALALRMAHQLRSYFPDGVFWFSLEHSSPTSILQKMVQLLGSSSSAHLSHEKLVERYQSLVWNREMLLILDSLDRATQPDQLAGLFPKGSRCATLCTSAFPKSELVPPAQTLELKLLKQEEQTDLMKAIIGEAFLKEHMQALTKIAQVIHGHPLALRILSQQIAFQKTTPEQAIKKLMKDDIPLSTFQYEETNLRNSFLDLYEKVSGDQQSVLQVVAFFDGLLSIDFISACLQLSEEQTKDLLEGLSSLSLLEYAGSGQYRMHRLLRTFLKKKSQNSLFLQRAADFYTTALQRKASHNNIANYLFLEQDTILFIIQECLEHRFIPSAVDLWKQFRQFYWHTAYWKDFQRIASKLYKKCKKEGFLEYAADICLSDLARLWYYDNDFLQAQTYAMEAFLIAQQIKKKSLTALARIRLAKIFLMLDDPDQGLSFLRQAEAYFKPKQHHIQLSHIYRYMSEMYLDMKDYTMAMDLLAQAVKHLDLTRQYPEKDVYQAVLQSHLGVVTLLSAHYTDALVHFKRGLEIAQNKPLVRGTYTWLNTIGAGIALEKMQSPEAEVYLSNGVRIMKQLGIAASYSSINFFARALHKEIDVHLFPSR